MSLERVHRAIRPTPVPSCTSIDAPHIPLCASLHRVKPGQACCPYLLLLCRNVPFLPSSPRRGSFLASVLVHCTLSSTLWWCPFHFDPDPWEARSSSEGNFLLLGVPSHAVQSFRDLVLLGGLSLVPRELSPASLSPSMHTMGVEIPLFDVASPCRCPTPLPPLAVHVRRGHSPPLHTAITRLHYHHSRARVVSRALPITVCTVQPDGPLFTRLDKLHTFEPRGWDPIRAPRGARRNIRLREAVLPSHMMHFYAGGELVLLGPKYNA